MSIPVRVCSLSRQTPEWQGGQSERPVTQLHRHGAEETHFGNEKEAEGRPTTTPTGDQGKRHDERDQLNEMREEVIAEKVTGQVFSEMRRVQTELSERTDEPRVRQQRSTVTSPLEHRPETGHDQQIDGEDRRMKQIRGIERGDIRLQMTTADHAEKALAFRVHLIVLVLQIDHVEVGILRTQALQIL